MSLDLLLVIFAGIFGLLVGSFSNVLIWRIPRGENIAFPPSHCPNCDHPLAPKDLVPLFSWLSLGGKCRYCKAPIKPRYPVIEGLTGLAYAAIALAFPLTTYGLLAPLGLMLLFTLLLVGSAIDLDTFQLPDEITLTGVILGLIFAALPTGGMTRLLPTLPNAVEGALFGAGIVVLVSLLGSWVMRRFRERRFPEFPLGYQQISLGLLVGAWLGWPAALVAAALSAGVNVVTKKVVPIPELATLGGFVLSLVLSSAGTGPNILSMVNMALTGAGAVALLCGFYWWIHSLQSRRKTPNAEADSAAETPSDPVAMGFGDVKLMAAIGAFLGWQATLVAFVAAVPLGLLLALIFGKKLPFGPALAAGAVIALFWGPHLIAWYRGFTGM